MADKWEFYTGHHDRIHVRVGQRVTEGQHIADVGATGQATGPHVHFQIRQFGGGALMNPYTVYNAYPHTNVTTNQGENMFNNIQEVTEAYIQMRGVAGTQAEMQGWVGQSKQRWIQLSTAETNSTRQQLADVRQALANEQAKPPKEVIKIVEKIIEKPVEVIVQAPVDEKQVVVGVLQRFWNSLFKK